MCSWTWLPPSAAGRSSRSSGVRRTVSPPVSWCDLLEYNAGANTCICKRGCVESAAGHHRSAQHTTRFADSTAVCVALSPATLRRPFERRFRARSSHTASRLDRMSNSAAATHTPWPLPLGLRAGAGCRVVVAVQASGQSVGLPSVRRRTVLQRDEDATAILWRMHGARTFRTLAHRV